MRLEVAIKNVVQGRRLGEGSPWLLFFVLLTLAPPSSYFRPSPLLLYSFSLAHFPPLTLSLSLIPSLLLSHSANGGNVSSARGFHAAPYSFSLFLPSFLPVCLQRSSSSFFFKTRDWKSSTIHELRRAELFRYHSRSFVRVVCLSIRATPNENLRANEIHCLRGSPISAR